MKGAKDTDLASGNRHALSGMLLVTLSAVLFSLTGVFVKMIPADGWTIIVLRGVFSMVFFGGLMWARGSLTTELRSFGPSAWAATVCAAVSGITFILAFKYTSIANVALIYATAPFVAALIAWRWFAERPRRVVMCAGLVSLIGVGIIVRDTSGDGSIIGDILALTMTLAMASYLCIYRRYPKTPNTLPIVFANIVPLFISLALFSGVTVPVEDLPLIAIFSVSFCAAAYLLAEGSKWISSSESALLSALETPLAPVFGFLILGTLPSQSTLLGGVIIVIAGIAALTIKR